MLAGKVVLITGAGSGIGRATALKFAEQGARIAGLVLFLASSASSHITGSVIYIDGAESLLQG